MRIILLLFFLLTFPMANDCVEVFQERYPDFSDIENEEGLIQNFNIGFSNTTGNTNNLDVNAKYDLSSTLPSYENRHLKIMFDSSLFFTKTDSQKSNEEYLINLGLEQELDKEWLSYFSFNWLRNPEFRNYEHKTSLGVGLGKKIFFDGKQSITLKLGTSYNKEDYANTQEDENFSSLNQYFKYDNQLNKISKLYLTIGALQHFQSFKDDYEVLALLGVRFTVGEKINLIIEQEIAYDNLPPIGFKKTDTKSIVRLGYKF